jgi:hypothetical protein
MVLYKDTGDEYNTKVVARMLRVETGEVLSVTKAVIDGELGLTFK